jgi:dolichol-phosphate mannosyltransferase
LLQAGGFAVARASTCEDVTLARHLFLSGYDVGFYDGEHLAETEMHSGMVDCLRNWPRSLNLRDRFRPMAGIDGLANMVFLQVIPLILVATSLRSPGVTHPILLLNRILLGARIGVLAGTRRAYRDPRWTYWISPLADPLSLAVYATALVKRHHSWRGRRLVTEDV